MLCWPRLIFILTVMALGTLSGLSACGHKGDLYLPEPPAPTQAPPGAEVPQVSPESGKPSESSAHTTQPSS